MPHVVAHAARMWQTQRRRDPNTTHPMFEQAPQKFSEIVLEFLAG